MSEEFIGGFEDETQSPQEPTYPAFKRWPWSKWEIGTIGKNWKHLVGTLEDLDAQTNGQIVEDCPEYYI